MPRAAAAMLVRALLLGGVSACAAPAPATKPAVPAAADPTGACVVLDAATEPAGLAAERAWLHAKFPGWKAKSQDLGRDGEHVLDLLVVLDADGVEHRVCFDITAWFGKF